jgi:hypothetical protein
LSVLGVPGDHSLRKNPDELAELMLDWLTGIGL